MLAPLVDKGLTAPSPRQQASKVLADNEILVARQVFLNYYSVAETSMRLPHVNFEHTLAHSSTPHSGRLMHQAKNKLIREMAAIVVGTN